MKAISVDEAQENFEEYVALAKQREQIFIGDDGIAEVMLSVFVADKK